MATFSEKTCKLTVKILAYSVFFLKIFTKLTLNLLTTTIVAPPSNINKWQMGFNSAFKGLKS